MLDSIIFCSTLALCDSLHSLLCRCTLFLSCTPTFVNWALPANKPRVMCCVFIKNMLEKRTPIKDSVFCTERGGERGVWEKELSGAARLPRFGPGGGSPAPFCAAGWVPRCTPGCCPQAPHCARTTGTVPCPQAPCLSQAAPAI